MMNLDELKKFEAEEEAAMKAYYEEVVLKEVEAEEAAMKAYYEKEVKKMDEEDKEQLKCIFADLEANKEEEKRMTDEEWAYVDRMDAEYAEYMNGVFANEEIEVFPEEVKAWTTSTH